MSTRFWLTLATIALFLAACRPSRQEQTLSREEAAAQVLAQVVRSDTLARPVLVFAWPEPLQPGDILHPYEMEGFEPFPAHTILEAESWFFWIDDAPGAHFVHPNRFVLVDRATGEVQVSEEEWWPVLNGEGLWVTEEEYWNPENWVFSNFEATPLQHRSARGAPLTALAALPPLQASPGSAIVINGWRAGESGQEDFAADADGMHDVLTESGFDVTYLGPPEDDNPDRDGEPTVAAKSNWFREKARQMQPSQTLVIYVTGHGGVLEGGEGSLGGVFESFLRQDLARFNPGVHIIVILQGCKAGAFLDGLNDVADVTVTATNATDPSYGDLDPEGDPNPEDRGSEYTSGYIEDWRELLNDPAAQARLRERASQNGTNLWEELAALAHVSAAEKDVTFQRGWAFPTVRRGNPTTTRAAWTPTPEPTPVPTVAGTYQVRAEVASDPAGHRTYVGLADDFTVTVVANDDIIFEGDPPWVPVTGNLSADGTFFAAGKGMVAGFSDIQVTLEGTFENGGFSGEYTMGAGGGLPTGQAIVYDLEATALNPASGTPTPEGEPMEDIDETVEAFVDLFNQAFHDRNVDFLIGRLHPEVLSLYGEAACTAYLESVLVPELNLDVLSVEGPEPWTWRVDDRRIPIESAYAIEAELFTRGEAQETAAHFAPIEGRLYWFTDCGDPLP